MAVSGSVTAALVSEGNAAMAALMPPGTYLGGESLINFSFTFIWSGFSGDYPKGGFAFGVRAVSSSGSYTVYSMSYDTSAASGTYTMTGRCFTLGQYGSTVVDTLPDGEYELRLSVTPYIGSAAAGITKPILVGGIDTSRSVRITYMTPAAPIISTFDVYRSNASGVRADDGTYLRYSVVASIHKILADDAGVFRLRYRQAGASIWTDITVGSGVTAVSVSGAQVSGTFPILNSYEFELIVVDNYTTIVIPKLIPTGSVLMHFRADKTGIGIGKYAETANLLDVALPTKFGAGIAIGKNVDSGTILDVNYPARFRQAVSMDTPLPLTQGGTGATSAATALTSLGIRSGVSSFTCKSANYIDVSVTFSPAFSTTPQAIVLTPVATFSTAGSVNGWSILSKSATGFTYRFYHEGSNTPAVNMCWIAIQ